MTSSSGRVRAYAEGRAAVGDRKTGGCENEEIATVATRVSEDRRGALQSTTGLEIGFYADMSADAPYSLSAPPSPGRPPVARARYMYIPLYTSKKSVAGVPFCMAHDL